MSNNEGGAAQTGAIQSPLDDGLALGVQRRSSFVEEEDFRIADEGAGDGDALLLTAAEHGPSLAHHRLVLERQLADEVVGVGLFGSAFDIVLRESRLSVADVGRDGRAEEHRFLADDAHLRAQPLDVEIGQFVAVQFDVT